MELSGSSKSNLFDVIWRFYAWDLGGTDFVFRSYGVNIER